MFTHAPAHAGSLTQNGAAGSAPRHMTPCACHCAACRAAGHGNQCVVLRIGLLRLFHGEADPVDLVLQHYYHGASGWDTARFDAAILSVHYGPAVAGTQMDSAWACIRRCSTSLSQTRNSRC